MLRFARNDGEGFSPVQLPSGARSVVPYSPVDASILNCASALCGSVCKSCINCISGALARGDSLMESVWPGVSTKRAIASTAAFASGLAEATLLASGLDALDERLACGVAADILHARELRRDEIDDAAVAQ